MNKEVLKKLYQSGQTVFSFKGIALILKESNTKNLKSKVSYYVKEGDLVRLRKGIYSLDKDYKKEELANKVYTPSYISFETVLARAGVTFQYYSQIFSASYLSREIKIDGQKYVYKRIKEVILTNPKGVERKENFSIASLERAFLDVVYLNKDYYFDNLDPLDKKKTFELVKIYNDKKMEKNVKKYFKDNKNKRE